MAWFEPDRNAINNTQKWLFDGVEKFEDTKGVIRGCNLKNNRQYNG